MVGKLKYLRRFYFNVSLHVKRGKLKNTHCESSSFFRIMGISALKRKYFRAGKGEKIGKFYSNFCRKYNTIAALKKMFIGKRFF